MITSAVAERRYTVVNPLHPRDPALAALFGVGNESASGEQVTPVTASGEDTLFASERYLSETIAALPLGLYRRLNRGREKAENHWLYSRLHQQPSRYFAKYRQWRLAMNHLFYRGNFYWLIQPSREMPPFEFLPLNPDRVTPKWGVDGKPFYDYLSPKGQTVRLEYGEVFHVAFLPGEDGLTGRSVVSYQVDTIGRSLATSKQVEAGMRHNSMPNGVLKHKKTLSRTAKKNLSDDWQAIHGGVRNAGRVAILEEDMDFSPVSISNNDAQAVQILQYNAQSMARIARVPQHKVGILDRATFSNIEHQAIEAVQDSIQPICVNIEDEIWVSLIPDADKKSHYAKFNLDGLLRGDFLSRQQGLEIQRRNGIIDGDDWAELEERNPFTGGDLRFVPLNWVPLDQAGDTPDPEPQARSAITHAVWPYIRSHPRGEPTEERSLVLVLRLRSAFTPVIEDVARRLLRRECDNVERQFRRHAQERALSDFITWLDSFYAEARAGMAENLARCIGPFVEAVAAEAAGLVDAEPEGLEAFVRTYVAGLVSRWLTESREGILAAIANTDAEAAAAALEELLRSWRSARAAHVAHREVVQAGNAASVFVWRAAGVQQMRWVKGADCDQCDAMSGQVADVRGNFAEGIQHGPIHEGCQCGLVPA